MPESDARPLRDRNPPALRNGGFRLSAARSPNADPAASGALLAAAIGLCSAPRRGGGDEQGQAAGDDGQFRQPEGRRRQERAGAAVRGRRGPSRPARAARRLRPRPAHLRRMERGAAAGGDRAGDRHARVQEPQEAAQGRSRRRLHRRRHARPRRRPDQGARRGKRRRVPADRHLARRPAADAGAGAGSSPGAAPRGASSSSCPRSAARSRSSPAPPRRSPKRGSSCCRSNGRCATASSPISTPDAPGAKRATRSCAKSPSGWKKR